MAKAVSDRVSAAKQLHRRMGDVDAVVLTDCLEGKEKDHEPELWHHEPDMFAVISDMMLADGESKIRSMFIGNIGTADELVAAFRDGYGRMIANFTIMHTPITFDLAPLANIHTLDLTGCQQLTDVSALRTVRNLDLTMTDVEDVSQLGTVDTLILSCCKRITDVSHLGTVRVLILMGCDGVSDVSQLGSVHHLDLSRCCNVGDVSQLGSVHHLNLSGCPRVSCLSCLSGVAELVPPS